MIKFVSLSWFLRFYHFYGFFTAYLLYEEVMSVRLSAPHEPIISKFYFSWRTEYVYKRVCFSDKMIPIYFLRPSKVWSMLWHGSVWLILTNVTWKYYVLFWHFFVVFHHKICVFIIFISFSGKVSNFRNRILTNQKREWWFPTVSGTQWNCMKSTNVWY